MFPDCDVPALIENIEGIIDQSWHNDACPSFGATADGPRLWVEYPNPEDRDSGGSRFAVTYWCEAGEDGAEWSHHATAYEGDDMTEAVRVFMKTIHERKGRA